MSIQHHIDDATLMSFVAGTLSEPLSAVVACHINMCGRCRREMRDMEMLGGLLLDEGPAPQSGDLALPTLSSAKPPAGDARSPVDGLKKVLSGGLSGIAWKFLGPGIKYFDLPLGSKDTGYLRLMKFAPGLKLPEHTHRGGELTLVLQGGYSDEHGHYLPGDIADHDEDVLHRPVIDSDGECISLVAAEKPAIYTQLMPRLLQPLTGM